MKYGKRTFLSPGRVTAACLKLISHSYRTGTIQAVLQSAPGFQQLKQKKWLNVIKYDHCVEKTYKR